MLEEVGRGNQTAGTWFSEMFKGASRLLNGGRKETQGTKKDKAANRETSSCWIQNGGIPPPTQRLPFCRQATFGFDEEEVAMMKATQAGPRVKHASCDAGPAIEDPKLEDIFRVWCGREIDFMFGQ